MKAQELLTKLYENKHLSGKMKEVKRLKSLQKAFSHCACCQSPLSAQHEIQKDLGRVLEKLSCEKCDPVGLTRIYPLQ